MSNLLSTLQHPDVYIKAFERLFKRATKQNPLPPQGGVELISIYNNKRDFANVLAKTVSQGKYCTITNPFLSQGSNLSIKYSLTDLILQDVIITETLKQLSKNQRIKIDPALSEEMGFVNDLSAYIKNSRLQGYLSCYLTQYNFSLSEHSPLLTSTCYCWQQLLTTLNVNDTDKILCDIINYVYRPLLRNTDDNVYQLLSALPQSAQVTDILIHCDFAALDQSLKALPQGFYARTTKYLVVLAHSASELNSMNCMVHDYFTSSKRMVKLNVSRDVLLTDTNKNQQKNNTLGSVDNSSPVSRRPAVCPRDPDILPSAQANCILIDLPGSREQVVGRPNLNGQQTAITPSFNFFGMTLFFDGSIGLNHRQLTAWLMNFKIRLKATSMLISENNFRERGALLVHFIHCFLMDNILKNQSKIAKQMMHISNIEQINYIDREIAFLLASILSGHERNRSFNVVPGWKIRKVWKLKSIQDFLVTSHDILY